MRFDRESYRKLYVAESAEHRLLSLFARGLRDYLLRFATEDGTLLPGSKRAAEDLCRVLGASSGERRHVLAAVEELIGVGYLTLDPNGRLWITRYVEAQQARSPGALRQQRYRDNHSRVTRNATDDVTPPVTDNVTSNRRDLAELGEPPSGVTREARSRPKGGRLVPESWAPKPEHVNLAMQLGVQLEPESQKFRDHEFYRTITDWDRAFSNWIRRSIELKRVAIAAKTGDRGADQLERQMARISALEAQEAKALP